MSDDKESIPDIPRRPKRLAKGSSSSSDTSLTTSIEPVIPQRPHKQKATVSESTPAPDSVDSEPIEASQLESGHSATPSVPDRPTKGPITESELDGVDEVAPTTEAAERPSTKDEPSIAPQGPEEEDELVKSTIPSVPERPVKTPMAGLEPSRSATPTIPVRPSKSSSNSVIPGVDDDREDESEPADTTTVPETDNEVATAETEVHHSHQVQEEEPTESSIQDSDSQLHSELPETSQQDQAEAEGEEEISKLENDGETTPGNSKTKVSFKDDEGDELSRVESTASNFNDDAETVLQEGETSSGREVQSIVQEEEQSTEKDENLTNEETSSSLGHQENVENNQTVPDIGVAEVKKQVVIDESESAKDKDVTPVPSIPIRPSKRPVKKTIDTSNSESPVVDADDKESTNELKQAPETQPEQSSLPKIPERPAKPSSLHEGGSKPKPPPPKPKKLSSKMAAFQQMFNQEAPLPSPSKPPIDFVKKDLEISSGTKRLSNDKMKFAESLKGMMGIPLPGMVNPLLHKELHGSDDQESKGVDEEEDKEVASGSTKLGKPASRPRGPRGKKLPKALKEPVNIEDESKFKLHTYDLWEVSFKKEIPKVEALQEEVLQTETLPKEEIELDKEIVSNTDHIEKEVDEESKDAPPIDETTESEVLDHSKTAPSADDATVEDLAKDVSGKEGNEEKKNIDEDPEKQMEEEEEGKNEIVDHEAAPQETPSEALKSEKDEEDKEIDDVEEKEVVPETPTEPVSTQSTEKEPEATGTSSQHEADPSVEDEIQHD